MTPDELRRDAANLLHQLTDRGLRVATAESCTGGLIAGFLTEIAQSSRGFDRGFVTYSIEAKIEMLGVDRALIERVGAVSRDVAIAMAEGALARSRAEIAVAVTGVAGPDGGTVAKPVGLVHLAAACTGRTIVDQECRFGNIGRANIRYAAIAAAFALIRRVAGL